MTAKKPNPMKGFALCDEGTKTFLQKALRHRLGKDGVARFVKIYKGERK